MAFPDGVPHRTVTTGLPITGYGGVPASGRLTFTGPPLVTVGPLQLLLGGPPGRLDLVDGLGSIDLPPNDVDGMSPTGWAYRVDAEFTDGTGWTRYLSVASGGGVLELATNLVADPVAAQFTTLLDPSTLGGAALLDVGTGAGKVAAGTTLATAQQYADQAAAAALVSAKAYTDQHAGGGGGGGVVPVWYNTELDAGIIHLPGPTSSWTPVVGSNSVAIARDIVDAAVGDVIEVDASFLRIGASMQLDARFVADGVPVRYFGAAAATPTSPGSEGDPMWYSGTSFRPTTASRSFILQEGDVGADGTLRIELVYRGPDIPADDSHTLYWGASVGYPGHLEATHWKIGAR